MHKKIIDSRSFLDIKNDLKLYIFIKLFYQITILRNLVKVAKNMV